LKQWIDTGLTTGFFFSRLDLDTTIAVSLLFGLAAAIGLWRAYLRSRRLGAVLGGWFVLLGILAGARVGFVLLHIEYYRLHANEIARFWLGGLNGVGALWGGVLFSLLLSIRIRTNWKAYLDEASTFILPFSLAAWIGEGLPSLMGGNADVYPGMFGLADMLRKWMPTLAALVFLLVLGLAERLTHISRPGLRGAWLVLLVSLLSLGLNLANPSGERPLFGMSGGVFLWLVSSVLSLFILVPLYLQSRKTPTIKSEIEHPEVIHEA
jgi:hypothetical protein